MIDRLNFLSSSCVLQLYASFSFVVNYYLWCFSILVNYSLQVCFTEKAVLYEAKITKKIAIERKKNDL